MCIHGQLFVPPELQPSRRGRGVVGAAGRQDGGGFPLPVVPRRALEAGELTHCLPGSCAASSWDVLVLASPTQLWPLMEGRGQAGTCIPEWVKTEPPNPLLHKTLT